MVEKRDETVGMDWVVYMMDMVMMQSITWTGWYGMDDKMVGWMVGWMERMHGRDTALNRGSCNATTMHTLHHQQFNQIFPLLHIFNF